MKRNNSIAIQKFQFLRLKECEIICVSTLTRDCEIVCVQNPPDIINNQEDSKMPRKRPETRLNKISKMLIEKSINQKQYKIFKKL